MSLFEAQPRSTIEDGNYVATVRSAERDVITPRKGRNAGKDVDIVRWTWYLDEVQEDVESITGIDPTSEKSNLFSVLVALVGTNRDAWLALTPPELVGRKALVQVTNDADGWPKVTSVTALPKGMRPPAQPVGAPVGSPVATTVPVEVTEAPIAEAVQATLVPADAEDDLPF